MIKRKDISIRKNAEDILNLQILSYQVEAEIIGSYGIPPLKDTVDTLQSCGETFFGYYDNEALCGAISIRVDDETLDIHRLIVHPNHFRRGIAQMLFHFIESKFKVQIIKVATGSNNTPAIHFYKKNGFQKMKEVRVNKQLSLTFFEKRIINKEEINMANNKKELSLEQQGELLETLQARFEKNMNRHEGLEWAKVQAKLEANSDKLWSLNEMERTGGEPDVVDYDKEKDEYTFYDCSAESPKGRRSVCYDREALEARKKHKPDNSAIDMATDMGIKLLTEEQYRALQEMKSVDLKTSSWVQTPSDIREQGGALFCDYRYGHVFLYHNGASSYYAARGFRGSLRV
ncbi:GNAT family N-acetyltransferase [Gracilibacillus thailandensis]|uniref:GNAT family N-acetyltransferase n=2 Tax=Gracilibacillus thailandensis TaxID=563735 RepID=A0A6N7R535_9BACI|nr:GNAT family N-acetyltransferase [Gracilibacillus thailandensis]